MGRPRAPARRRHPVRRQRALHARAHVPGAGRAARDGPRGRGRATRPGRPSNPARGRRGRNGGRDPRDDRPRCAGRHRRDRRPVRGARRPPARRRGLRRLLHPARRRRRPGVARAVRRGPPRADSVVVDPHKHGLQPYGCGSVIFADPGVGRLYAHDSPYTYFTSADLHLGEISLECSRAAPRRPRCGPRSGPCRSRARGSACTSERPGAPPGGCRTRCAGGRRGAGGRPGAGHRLLFRAAVARLGHQRGDRAGVRRARRRRVASGQAPAGHQWIRRRHPWIEADAQNVTVLRSCLLKREHLEVVDDLSRAIAGALT